MSTLGSRMGSPPIRRSRVRSAPPPGMAVRMQQTHGDRLGVDLRQRVERERLELAIRTHPPRHAEAALERDERLRVRGTQPVEMRACLPTEVEKVLEARVRDECGAR